MKKLNGVKSIGSVVVYKGVQCVVTNAFETEQAGKTVLAYNLSAVSKSVGYYRITENMFQVEVLKTPLEKHLSVLDSINKEIKVLEKQRAEEMKAIEADHGWDDMDYDDYEEDHSFIEDGISCASGLDELNDQCEELLYEMAKTAVIAA